MNDAGTNPVLASLRARGELPTALRDRIRQARQDLGEREDAEALEMIGVQAARSRVEYLLSFALEHRIDVESGLQATAAAAAAQE